MSYMNYHCGLKSIIALLLTKQLLTFAGPKFSDILKAKNFVINKSDRTISSSERKLHLRVKIELVLVKF